jgi:hypothetical protein
MRTVSIYFGTRRLTWQAPSIHHKDDVSSFRDAALRRTRMISGCDFAGLSTRLCSSNDQPTRPA